MAANIFLSIVIPTRNQEGALATTLESILPQLTDEVEVVVNDNSTNTKTADIMRERFQNPRIRYFRDQAGLGIDRYVLLGTERARGAFVWWFGDDLFEPDALSYALSVLKQNPHISFMWVNSINVDANNHRFPSLPYTEDKLWKDGNEALKDASSLLAFFSATIFRKADVADIDTTMMNAFIGLGWIHFYIALYLLSKPNIFYCVRKPLLEVRPTPAGKATYDRFNMFAVNYYKVASEFRDRFSRDSMRVLLASNFGGVWRGVLVGWLRGYDTPKKKVGVIFRYYRNLPEAWVAMFLFLMPKPIIAFIYFVYKKILRRTYSAN